MNTESPIHIWSLRVPDHQPETELYRSYLTAQELDRAAKLIRPGDAEHFILCRGLLRKTLATALNRDPAELSFRCNEQGKPFVEGETLEFNLSHSRDRLLIALAPDRPVGVDLEFRRSGINMSAIAERWFTPEERASLLTADSPERRFFSIWTQKEAYVKALGTGIFQGLESFNVPAGEGGPIAGQDGEWFFQTLEIDPAYAAALVSSLPAIPAKIFSL